MRFMYHAVVCYLCDVDSSNNKKYAAESLNWVLPTIEFTGCCYWLSLGDVVAMTVAAIMVDMRIEIIVQKIR